MDLVDLMYQYINRFINSDELLEKLEKIDFSKYTSRERKIIKQLILDIKNIKETVPNEVDEVEKKRIEQIDAMLKFFGTAKESKTSDKETVDFIEKQYNRLLKNREIIKDGGKRYEDILLTNNSLIYKYAKEMDDEELLEFITHYISAPVPPNITQDSFDALVSVGIKKDKRESLWRLAFNYNHKKNGFF